MTRKISRPLLPKSIPFKRPWCFVFKQLKNWIMTQNRLSQSYINGIEFEYNVFERVFSKMLQINCSNKLTSTQVWILHLLTKLNFGSIESVNKMAIFDDASTPSISSRSDCMPRCTTNCVENGGNDGLHFLSMYLQNRWKII